MNAKRTNNTNDRLCIPRVPEEDYVQAVKAIVSVDQDWIPTEPGTSLYIRPFIIATEGKLGVHASNSYYYVVVLSPSGPTTPPGSTRSRSTSRNPTSARAGRDGLCQDRRQLRRSLRAGNRAEQKGYTQVLWLDGVHRKYIEEVGAMNVMFKVNGKILTPDLNGSVLDGITRRSCIQLLKDWGYEVEERRISAEELFQAAKDGTLEEAWAPVPPPWFPPSASWPWTTRRSPSPTNQIRPVTQKLYDALTDIQWGRAEDPHNWIMKLC